ncbi:hypothetical protein KIPB_001689, partial [Kipferlia bialata]|eukprot:g1689.t1
MCGTGLSGRIRTIGASSLRFHSIVSTGDSILAVEDTGDVVSFSSAGGLPKRSQDYALPFLRCSRVVASADGTAMAALRPDS